MLFLMVASIYFLIMAMTVTYWGAHIRSLNKSGYARTILLLCFAMSTYILGYAMELNAVSEPWILFWNRAEYLGIPFVSALWLLVALQYTGHFSRFRRLLLTAMFGIPFTTLVLRQTNTLHHLYFANEGFVREFGKLMFVKTPGPWMYVQLVHSMLMIFAAMGLFLADSVGSEEKDAGKIRLIIAASFFAASGLVLTMVRPLGLHIDYMAFCLPLAAILVIFSILRYDFLETRFLAESMVFEASRDAILLVNRKNKVIDTNRSTEELLRRIGAESVGGSLEDLFLQAPALLQSLRSTETSIAKLELGTEREYYEVSTKSIDPQRESRGWMKTIRDVTEIYQLNESLKVQALMDELSGLNNRRAFLQSGQLRMADSDRTGRALHLLMMDLDHFKNVNDQYGHPAGDLVIQNFSALLKEVFGPDSLIARLGGEEFGVLTAGPSAAEVRRQAEILQKRMEGFEHRYGDKSFRVTVSIGIAGKSGFGQTLEELLHLADKALYRSKDSGRNRTTVL